MERKQLQRQKEALAKEKKELQEVEARLGGADGLGASLREGIGELSAYDNHPGDLGSEMYERSKDLGLLENIRQQIAEIEEAQRALKEGTYGFCRSCGRSIAEMRLLALPRTLLCMQCQREKEGQSLEGRPVEEELLFPPFGRTFTDEEDSVIFDGEDSWEAVARYGTSSLSEKR
ncbi:MAG: transcriptional regulator [Firmicutes bacterium]|nr:transcriptional regulator [Bacillota bacterium]